MQEVVKCIKIIKMQALETVFEFGSEGKYFYIILSGEVGVNIPNPIIKNWKDKYAEYLDLKKWYDEVFNLRKN
jgi:hypothetical protein